MVIDELLYFVFCVLLRADPHFNVQKQAQLQDNTVNLEEREREMHQLEVS